MPKFKSKFERYGYELLSKHGWEYEPKGVDFLYAVPHRYIPDFVKKGKPILEFKGRFRSPAEATKYVWVRESNPTIEIVFVFEKPDVPFPFSKKRKNGTRMTHREWAEKNNFQWYTLSTIPKSYLK